MRAGLPNEYKPQKVRPADAYRRASKSIEGRKDFDNGERVEILVRDVWHNTEEVVRYVVLEHRDPKGRRLAYDTKAAMLRFDHVYKMIDAEVYSTVAFVRDAVSQFEHNYWLFLRTYDGAAKRRVVRAVLNDLAATALKDSGGVYLIPRQHEELLFQLVRFLDELPACKGYKMSVEDSSETRDMVRDLVTHKAEAILKEIRAVLQGEVDERTVQELLARARQVRREVALYQEVLRESIGTLETDVELLQAQILTLVEKL